jgi:hypothetical protein
MRLDFGQRRVELTSARRLISAWAAETRLHATHIVLTK